MPSLQTFLDGYRNREAQVQAEPMREMQQMGALQQILAQSEKAKQARNASAMEAQFRSELSALGPNPDQAALAAVASKYASPKDVLTTQQSSLDRQAASADRKSIADENRAQMALQFAQNLDLRQQDLDRRREEFAQRTTDAQSRAAFDQWYKTESLKNQKNQAALNAQLRGLGFEIQRQGQQLQLARFDQQAQQRVDTQTTAFANELQQNKIPALTSSITAANELFGKYKDKDIPGFGVVEGSRLVPNMLRTEEANNVRSASQAVSNDLLNLYSGLAVTLPEGERRELEEMRNGTFTSKDFKNAWPRVVERYNQVIGNLRASASEPVFRTYTSRPGALKLEPLVPAFGAGPKAGDVVDGYKFKGGNPADRKNWEKQ